MRKIRAFVAQLLLDDFYSGVKELFWMCFFGVMPLWAGWLILRLYGGAFASHFIDQFVFDGDLLLISSAILGPLMYPLLRHYQRKDNTNVPFPINWFFVAIIFVIAIVSTLYFDNLKLSRSTLFPQPIAIPIDRTYVLSVSYICAATSVFCTFLITTIKSLMEHFDVPQVFREDTEEFIKEWKK